jgi:UrcA family protein
MIMTAFFKLSILAAGLVAANTAALAEIAADDTVVTGEQRDDKVSTYVYYSDLNLASETGVKRLETRVRSAARNICFSNGIQPIDMQMQERRCFREAMDSAEPQIADAVRDYGTAVAMRAPAITISRQKG